MKTVFTNGRIILTDRILDGYSVIVEDGVISDVTKSTAAADKVVDPNVGTISGTIPSARSCS